MSGEIVRGFLTEARRREKVRTLIYRTLAAEAELAGDADASERLNGLHADEQHHLSRLTARLLELGGEPEELGGLPRPELPLEGWEARARELEADEVDFYEEATALDLDPDTAEIVDEILASERMHLEHLGGKWMPA